MVSQQDQDELIAFRQKQATKLTDDQLKQRAISAARKPSRTRQRVEQYERNSWIAEYAKGLANGVCQLCQKPAPFCNDKGQPYLETHHIKWLSLGGEDSVDNTVALCPNCHRKMHVVNDVRDIQILEQRVKLLVNGKEE